MKSVVTETETDALTRYLAEASVRLSCRIVDVELSRAVARREPGLSARVDEVLAAIALVELDPAIVYSAARVDPLALRSPDAIHLASALALGGDLDAFVTYDARLADAARAAGLTVVSPGA